MSMFFVRLMSALVCALAFVCMANGQEVRGTVTDSTGAVVPGARVQILSAGKLINETESNSAGRFTISGRPGRSILKVSAANFQTFTRALEVSAERNLNVDVLLRLEGVEQSITVEADEAQASLERVPGSTAYIPEGEIRNSLSVTLKDVLGFAPGVLVQPRFGADESQLSIRGSGLRSNFHSRGVNLFINGKPYQDADGFSDFEALELQSVRSIEIWKGANALRYGGNTSGGAVNFVTYDGGTSAPFHVSVEGGSYGLFKAQVSTGGVHGPLSYYVSVADTEIDGYRQHSEQGRQRLYGNLQWRLSDATRANFDLVYVNAAEKLPGALTATEFRVNPRQADPNNVTNDWGRFQNTVRLGADLTHRIDDHNELQVIAYGQYRSLWHPIFQVLEQQTRTLGGEVRYRYFGSLFGRRDRFVVGIAPQTGTQSDRNYLNVLGKPGALAAAYGNRATNWGLYFENQLDVSRGVTIVVGGRADSAYRQFDDRFLSDGNQSDRRTFRAFSPKFGFTWQVSESAQLFGNVSRSYEPPLLLELTSFGAPGFLPLKPQDSWQFEFGSRGTISDRVNWDVALFDLEVSDEILNVNVMPFPGAPFTIPSYRNAPKTRHVGVELGVGATLKRGLLTAKDRLLFRTAYTAARYTFVQDPTFAGNRLPGQPGHLMRGEFRYETSSGFWLAPALDWSPADYFVNSANTAINSQYAAISVKSGFDWRNWGLFLNAANLSNRNYSASVQVDAANGRFYEPANRRSVYGGVRWHF